MGEGGSGGRIRAGYLPQINRLGDPYAYLFSYAAYVAGNVAIGWLPVEVPWPIRLAGYRWNAVQNPTGINCYVQLALNASTGTGLTPTTRVTGSSKTWTNALEASFQRGVAAGDYFYDFNLGSSVVVAPGHYWIQVHMQARVATATAAFRVMTIRGHYNGHGDWRQTTAIADANYANQSLLDTPGTLASPSAAAAEQQNPMISLICNEL